MISHFRATGRALTYESRGDFQNHALKYGHTLARTRKIKIKEQKRKSSWRVANSPRNPDSSWALPGVRLQIHSPRDPYFQGQTPGEGSGSYATGMAEAPRGVGRWLYAHQTNSRWATTGVHLSRRKAGFVRGLVDWHEGEDSGG
jgi:hypothetical protein